MSFIHTFSLVTKITDEDLESMKRVYQRNEFFWNGDTKRWILGKYADKGLRIEVMNRHKKSIRYDKAYTKKAVMIFTLYKLVYTGEKMGEIYSERDVEAALQTVAELLYEIHEKTGTDLWKNAKVYRVDVTHDVITPSEDYSDEIIRIAKKSLLKCGYQFWKPEKKEINKQWSLDDSAFLYNHNQEVEGKIYNKRKDYDIEDFFPEDIGKKGIIRFELSLKGAYLREHEYISRRTVSMRELMAMLALVMRDASRLLEKHLTDVLGTGDILSKNILKKYIRVKYERKEKKIEKMFDYMDWINNDSQNRKYKGTDAAKRYFKELGVSPVYSKKECPYIPAYQKLFAGEVNMELLKKAKTYNEQRRHYYDYWFDI